MVRLDINGLEAVAAEGATVLETARFYGVEIPTLCNYPGLSPYGACRLCLVEVGRPGSTSLVSACTYPVREGLTVRTHSERATRARRLLLELYLATCPSSKVLQDLAAHHHVTAVRFKQKYEDCILCSRCARFCLEQMQGYAIGFVSRGADRRVASPFFKKAETCRLCGGCLYICPVCSARCQGPEEKNALCSACLNLSPPCLEQHGDLLCYLDPCVACEAAKPQPPASSAT